MIDLKNVKMKYNYIKIEDLNNKTLITVLTYDNLNFEMEIFIEEKRVSIYEIKALSDQSLKNAIKSAYSYFIKKRMFN